MYGDFRSKIHQFNSFDLKKELVGKQIVYQLNAFVL